MTQTCVIVVGAGPVGLALAAELRLGGAEVIVLERLERPSTESRASTVHARTMELLASRGLIDELGTPPNEPMGHFGGIPLDLTLPSSYPGQWKVPQPRLTAVLRDWAAGLGADIRYGKEVLDLEVADHQVAVLTKSGTLTCQYLVGCDGEDSVVRGLAEFDFPGQPARRELIRADVAGIDIPARRFERLDAGLAIAAHRDGVTRVMVHEFGAAPAPRSAEPGLTEIATVWKRVTGEDISGGKLLWSNAFTDENRQVANYRSGRVLLAGDSAHRQLPTGGQALNLGLQDAFNLGWKLAAEVTGTASPGLLDTYHGERHPVGKRVLANIKVQAELLLGGPEVEPVRTLFAELLELPDVRAHLAAMITGLDAV